MNYALRDSNKHWKNKWFIMGNLLPSMDTHSLEAPKVNSHWEEENLQEHELEWIRPLIKQIKALKDWGLTGESVAASFMRRRIQPLQ